MKIQFLLINAANESFGITFFQSNIGILYMNLFTEQNFFQKYNLCEFYF